MNDREHFERVLSNVTYRDWRFVVGIDADRYFLQVEFDAPDAFEPSAVEVQRGRKWFLSPYMTRSEVVQTAHMAVQAAVEHEAREDFRYRGEAVFGPHFDVETLVVLAWDDAGHDVRKAA